MYQLYEIFKILAFLTYLATFVWDFGIKYTKPNLEMYQDKNQNHKTLKIV